MYMIRKIGKKKKKSEISKVKFCIIYRVFFVKVSVWGSPGRQDR